MKYNKKLEYLKEKIVSYLENIFKVYGNELALMLEDYNLLSSPNNCIETSTATGFIIEEFVASKLATYTKDNKKSEIKIVKDNQSTVNISYDCYAMFDKTKVLINIKSEKNTSKNNAVAAINILHRDYCLTDPKQEKAYMILKVCYAFNKSKKDSERKIFIKKIQSYFLEEVDFSSGHRQDHRNWSSEFNPNSGRLQVSDSWRNSHKLDYKTISYETTKSLIKMMFSIKK